MANAAEPFNFDQLVAGRTLLHCPILPRSLVQKEKAGEMAAGPSALR
jgi:hypothetical protein